ncbi:MAG: adenylate kinase [Ignavibacteria bacterium]|nr:adenylate kinase [Ignavibacteria bacterium]
MYKLIIFGAPGAGKGTQADLLAKKLDLFHFSTGNYLRELATKETQIGKKVKQILDKGELVPDDIMIEIIKEALENNNKQNGFILDGFPRTIRQAEELDKIFKSMNLHDIIVIYLNVPDEEIIKRLLLRGRSDDNEEIVRKRLSVYKETTSKVLEYYKTNNKKIVEVNGIGDIEEINNIIISKITKNYYI